MKRIAIIVLVALAICGCQVKEVVEFTPESKIDQEDKVFTAVIEDNNPETKTSLDNSGNILWKQGDQVSIFAGSTVNGHYQVSDESDGMTSASLYKITGGGFVAGTDISNNVAYYPYASTAAIAKDNGGYVISGITLPATQSYAVGSFGNGDFPMAAVTSSTEDLTISFKNVLGGLKLQLTGTATIASISVTGNSNEIFCGAAKVTMAYGSVPSITLTDATAKTVTLDCGEGVQLNEENAVPFIIALPPMTMAGGFTVIVTDTEGGQMTIKTTKPQTITRSNLLKMPAVTYAGTAPEPEHQYVDLGLPSGLKWATCNVGANLPEDYGDYFAWGETEPYYSSLDPLTWKDGKSAGYDWASYRWGGRNTLIKYNIDSSYGSVDNKTTLELQDDAANSNWGGSWRMPTYDDWTELRTKCTWTWTEQNGVYGRLVTGSNGNSIFLPAASFRAYTDDSGPASVGYYWSSSLPWPPYDAWFVIFDSTSIGHDTDNYRCFGLSVRPVSDEGVKVPVSGISLDRDAIDMEEGSTVTLIASVTPSNATQPAVIWSSSNTAVATVDYTGVVTAIKEGSAIITATTYDGGLTASCEVTVSKPSTGTENGHVWVDLGLPSGLKWATCNVGANSPTDYGDYFAWGETEPYYSSLDPLTWKDGKSAGYDWASYKWCNGSQNTLTKYNTDSSFGTVDNKTSLDLEDDSARANWGGSWRMPTYDDWTELRTKCTWTWTEQNGVYGRLVTGSNGNSIFLPAASFRAYTDDSGPASVGYYWSSSLPWPPYDAWFVIFDSTSIGGLDTDNYRCFGLSVRPVTE